MPLIGPFFVAKPRFGGTTALSMCTVACWVGLIALAQARDVDSGFVDAREKWVSPYFSATKDASDKLWLFSFDESAPELAGHVCPFVLVEVSRDPVGVTLESPGKSFRLKLLANQAIITSPGHDRDLSESLYGGQWYEKFGRQGLAPSERTWHPKGSDVVKGTVRLPSSLGSEDLRKLLDDAAALDSIKIKIVGDTSCEVALKDLPDNEKAAAVYDLCLANATRWIRKHCGSPVQLSTRNLSYQPQGWAARKLLEAMPEEWQRLRDASNPQGANLKIFIVALGEVINENGAIQNAINAALQQNAVLQQPIDRLDAESIAMLLEMVATKFDERLTKPASSLLLGNPASLDNLDKAVATGQELAILDAWTRISPEEKDALVLLSTRSLFGRLRCPHSKLTHIGLMARACEVVAQSGPRVRAELQNSEREAIEKLLHEQRESVEKKLLDKAGHEPAADVERPAKEQTANKQATSAEVDSVRPQPQEMQQRDAAPENREKNKGLSDVQETILASLIGRWGNSHNSDRQEICANGSYLVNGDPSHEWSGRWSLDMQDAKGPCLVRESNNGRTTRFYMNLANPNQLKHPHGVLTRER